MSWYSILETISLLVTANIQQFIFAKIVTEFWCSLFQLTSSCSDFNLVITSVCSLSFENLNIREIYDLFHIFTEYWLCEVTQVSAFLKLSHWYLSFWHNLIVIFQKVLWSPSLHLIIEVKIVWMVDMLCPMTKIGVDTQCIWHRIYTHHTSIAEQFYIILSLPLMYN